MPTTHSFYSQRLRLSYVDYGTAGNPLLVLVHGGRDHARNWDLVAEELRPYYHVIAPDLRGHGDSAWAIGSQYNIADYVLDLAQLLRHVDEGPVTLVGHSLGAIEGMGPPPEMVKALSDTPIEERMRNWISTMQDLAGRKPREYSSLEEAVDRMHEANPHLSPEMAHHLTVQGTMRLEHGAWVWKFDNYVRAFGPARYDTEGVQRLWNRIESPVLLVRGAESWASNPEEDGRAEHFRNYTYAEIEGAGHWVHHDQFGVFMGHLRRFLNLG